MEAKSKRDEVIELANKLFIYTDSQEWNKLLQEVFTQKVLFDMSSLGAGDPVEMKASEICSNWKEGFKGLDSVHHQSGNFLVKFRNDDTEADVFCYAVATHFKQGAILGTRSFTGSYNLHAVLTDQGWRLDKFKYNMKYLSGNQELK